MAKVADLSNWSGFPDQDDINKLKAINVWKAIIGTRGHTKASFARQAQPFLDNGMGIESYIYLYWAEDGQRQAYKALDTMLPSIKMIWPDVEFDNNNLFISTQNCVDVLSGCYVTLGERADGLYTSISMWEQSGLGTRFSDKSLWDASYGNLPRPWRPYGGWSHRELVQYGGNVTVGKLSVDLNEEEPMTKEERDVMEALGRAVFDQGRRLGDAETKQTSQGAILFDHGVRINKLEGKK